MTRLKQVVYTDENGWKRSSLVRPEDGENEGKYGIPLGPPDISRLDWDAIKRDINNVLTDLNVLTWDDWQKKSEISTAVCSVIRRAMVDLYRQDDIDRKR